MAKKAKKEEVTAVESVGTPKVETKSKSISFGEGIVKVSGFLADSPDALAVGIVSKPNLDGGMERVYAFLNSGAAAKAARTKIAEVLREVYQGGAYSIMQFATALRVDEKAVQGLIDEEFIERQGLDL